jgi:hypothetical protein
MTKDFPLGLADKSLPPLSPEDYVCAACEFDFATIEVPDALSVIVALPGEISGAVVLIPDGRLRRRPAPDVWSAMEYLCHLRDVYATYTIRLHRARTEDSPAVEPMFSDLRALRFQYSQLPLAPVLDEFEKHVAGLRDEAAMMAPEDWLRTVSRRPQEVRTAAWLVRQAAHEGRHHLADIRDVLKRAGTS